MNKSRKILAIVLSVLMLANAASVGMVVSAEESGAQTGLRWFPVPEERQNDDVWEVECWAEGCLCQRFTETAEVNGYTNFLDTEYTAEGGLTLSRNDTTITIDGADYTNWYWPRIRTISLETSPEYDLKNADTLYFDLTAHGSTQWNISMSFNGMVISLGKFMAEAAGATDMDAKNPDAPAGTYKGSLSLNEIIARVAADTSHLDNVNAKAIQNMKKCFVPQLQIYVVGDTASSLTIRELYVSTADDAAGNNCAFIDMGLMTGFGEEYYEMLEEEEDTSDEYEEPAEDEFESETDTEEAPESDTETIGTQATPGGTTLPENTGFLGWLRSLGGVFAWFADLLDSIF